MRQIILFFGLLLLAFNAIAANPNIQFSVDKKEGFGPLTIQFNASNIKAAKKFHWSFGTGDVLTTNDSIIKYTFKSTGTYNVSLKYAVNASDKDLKNLKDTGSIQIKVLPKPIVPPVALFDCINTGIRSIHCKSNSSDEDGIIVKQIWSLDDGKIFEEVEFDHKFVEGAVHQISLTVTDNDGASSSISKNHQLKLNQTPTFDLVTDVTSGNAPLRVHFKATNVADIDGSISSILWNFGDNTSSSESDVFHTFNVSGTYNVVLKIADDRGEFTTKNVNIVVKDPPIIANLECSTNNLLVNCNALGTTNLNSIPLIYLFNYGDGFTESNSTGISSHAYVSSGTFEVVLTVGNGLGVNSEARAIVMPLEPKNIIPNIALNCTSTEPMSVSCSTSASDEDGYISKIQFLFDDGQTIEASLGVSIKHTFTNSGLHSISAVAIDNDGGISTPAIVTVNILENANPIADFNCQNVSIQKIYCNSLSNDTDGEISSATWIIDNGEELIGNSFEHFFDSGKTHSIKLAVVDNLGGKSIIEKNIEILLNSSPVAIINCQTSGNKIVCDSFSSYDPDGQALICNWDFGDGITATGNLVEHTYQSFGHYNVTLSVTDEMFAIASTMQTFPITNLIPIAVGSCQLLGKLLNCDGSQSSDPDGNIVSYEWIISGEPVQIGTKIAYELTTLSSDVSLRIKDNFNNVAEVYIGKFEVVEETVGQTIAQFQCVQVGYENLKCDAHQSKGQVEIVSYEWKVSDTQFQGIEQEFAFGDQDFLRVSLTVTDKNGVSDTVEFDFERGPGELELTSTSSGAIKLLGSEEIFFPLQSNLNFKVENVILADNFESNSFILNEIDMDPSSIIYDANTNTFLIPLNFQDGRNSLEMKIFDNDGNYIIVRKEFYAGSKILQLSILDEAKNSIATGRVQFNVAGEKNIIANYIFSDSNFSIANVPDIDLGIMGASGELSGNNLLLVGDSNLTLDLHSYSPITDLKNNDFSNGISGWQISNASYTLNTDSLILRAGAEGNAILRRSLKPESSESQFVTFRYDIYSEDENNYYSITLRNKSTGEVNYKIFKTVNNNLNLQDNLFFLNEKIAVNSMNDIVEVELKLFQKPSTEVVSNFFLDLFFNRAYASGAPASFYAKIFAVYFQDKLSNVIVSDASFLFNKYLKIPMGFLSVGRYPSYDGIPIFPMKGLIGSNPISISFDVPSKVQVLNTSIELFLPDEVEPFGQAQKYTGLKQPIDITTNQSVDLNVPSQNQLEWESLIDLKGVQKIITARVTFFLSNGDNEVHFFKFKPLVSLNEYNFLYEIMNGRFGTRDSHFGGDDWVQPKYLEHFDLLLWWLNICRNTI